ncbi:alkaline phosphatase PafA [Robertkochia sediminum]|uniref:alkaline phosphatase PafA n=1 Tax=Robertkochia sediminum TaxID=2785326 RepID=UPI001932CDE4|nr:alkaline phosphatase PafA [Robertkochia sediminum]MBL7472850.1 alkaline phosphatase family protein [Robertkochia sediminum]
MKQFCIFLLLAGFFVHGHAQEDQANDPPKLVVGIVVDQMRYEYLNRYWDRYGDGGFRRLVNEGFNFKNNHFNYVPTATAPGHASVYTGTTPSEHGIIGNDWFDVFSGEEVYCVSDPAYKSVGTKSDAGEMSPHRLRRNTLTDALRIYNNFKGKTIGVAIKDRGAVLPAGFTGTAYWFYGKDEGKWVSSTYYMEALPDWVKTFNKSDAAASYKRTWNTLYDSGSYVNSNPDNTNYERPFRGEEAAVFPHDLPALWKENGKYDIIKATPYGNSLTADFALAALEGESLGESGATDFLAVSFSSTDYVGHQFGVKAMETEDTYLRLDKDIERLLNALDEKIGKGQYLVFLTADHGAAYNSNYLKDHKLPSGFIEGRSLRDRLLAFAEKKYATNKVIRHLSWDQLFLDKRVIDSLELNAEEIRKDIANEMLTYEEIEKIFTADMLNANNYKTGIASLIQNGFNAKLSGDVMFVFRPGMLSAGYANGGTSHGTAYGYDTHVPFLLFGKGVRQGSTTIKTVIPDIAPTVSALLGIPFPNGATGTVRAEAYMD